MSVRRSGSSVSALPMDQILKDPVNLNYFKKYCMEEMSMENLLFWLEVQDFKQIEAPAYSGFMARKIYNKYVKAGASQQLSVEGSLRLSIQEKFDPKVINPKVFDEIQEACVLSMNLDIHPRFVDSPLYQELAALKFEERKVRAPAELHTLSAQVGALCG
eukprot:1020119-Prymnesium_polylepis.1